MTILARSIVWSTRLAETDGYTFDWDQCQHDPFGVSGFNHGAKAAKIMRDLSLVDVYRYLEPGPVVLLTTAKGGRANVMTMSWHMMVEFDPPLVACIVSEGSLSFDTLEESRECVIAIPTFDMASIVVGIGNCSGRKVDKLKKFELSHVPAAQVGAPLLPECFCNLECRISSHTLVKPYNLFILEVVKAWLDPTKHDPKTLHHKGHGRCSIDGKTIELESSMP